MGESGNLYERIFEEFASFMQRDTRGEEVLTYGLAGAGLLIALHKIRPFAKFTHPSDVPKHFFKKKVLLDGVVRNIEPAEQPYLLVDHKPVVPLPRFGQAKYLPVKLAGVHVTGNGLSWLQTVAKGQRIKFLPVARDSKFLSCIVTVPVKDKQAVSIGEELVKVGFGTVEEIKPVLTNNKDLEIYKKSLQVAQKWAEKRRNGVWFFKYSPTLLWRVRRKIDEKLKSALPPSLARFLDV